MLVTHFGCAQQPNSFRGQIIICNILFLTKVLVETVRTAQRHVTIMATILMAELLHLTNILLPPGYSSNAHCLPDLISSALDFHDPADRRK
jgi:hypothetical protein